MNILANGLVKVKEQLKNVESARIELKRANRITRLENKELETLFDMMRLKCTHYVKKPGITDIKTVCKHTDGPGWTCCPPDCPLV